MYGDIDGATLGTSYRHDDIPSEDSDSDNGSESEPEEEYQFPFGDSSAESEFYGFSSQSDPESEPEQEDQDLDLRCPSPVQKPNLSQPSKNQYLQNKKKCLKKLKKEVTKEDMIELRKRVRRPLVRWLKERINSKLGLCYTCNERNCPSFRDLEGMSPKVMLWHIKNRLRHPHPLYQCPMMRNCPLEHVMLHRVLYHHPLYTPQELVSVRVMLGLWLPSTQTRC
jgi:hypothetical protein